MQDELKFRIQQGLIALHSYQENMEKLLARGQEEILAKIQQIHRGQYDLSLEELNPFFASEFPRYLRYSFIALLISFLETELQAICIDLGNQNGLSEEAVKSQLVREGKVKRAKKFLKEQLRNQFSAEPTGGENPRRAFLRNWDRQWESVLFLVRVRHCILHAGGDITKLKASSDLEVLQEAKSPWPGYSLKDNVILLGREFCDAAYQGIQRRFASLFTLV